MKILIAIWFLIAGEILLHAGPIPAPGMTLKYSLDPDPRIWVLADSLTNGPVGGVTVYTSEWVPKGDAIQAWNEMFDQKAILTGDTIASQIAIWKTMLFQADPKAEAGVETNAYGSCTLTYKSITADEMGISRYLKGNDGIYIFSYRVRPELKKDERMKIWRDILSSATLVKNNK